MTVPFVKRHSLDRETVGAALLIAAALGWFVSQILTAESKVDDAYFTFSYAKNLALGNGPVFSHGVRVEGYSTFLWMALLTLPLAIVRDADPLLVARSLAIPFVGLIGWSSFAMVRALGGGRIAAAAALLMLAAHTDLAMAYSSGMETVPFVACVTFALVCTVLSFQDAAYRSPAIWAGLAVALMRIDGFLVFGFVLFCRLCHRRIGSVGVEGLWKEARTAMVAIAIYLAWFAWRWWYYGLPLPSTYYAKSDIAKLLPHRGVQYVWDALRSSGLGLAVLPWLWLVWRRNANALVLGGFSVLHLFYVTRVGGDWMPFARFILPVVPVLIALTVAGVAHAHRSLSTTATRIGFAAASLAGAAYLIASADHRFLNTSLENEAVSGVNEQRRNVDIYVKAASFLRQVIPVGGRLVTDYGGVFSYYTDASIIEMWGLANAEIATKGNHDGINPIYGKTCHACYAQLDPEFFHVMTPLIRRENDLSSAAQVRSLVWQSDAIGRYVNLADGFAAGRVVRKASDEALWFLQKRPSVGALQPKETEAGFRVEYPFEPQPAPRP